MEVWLQLNLQKHTEAMRDWFDRGGAVGVRLANWSHRTQDPVDSYSTFQIPKRVACKLLIQAFGLQTLCAGATYIEMVIATYLLLSSQFSFWLTALSPDRIPCFWIASVHAKRWTSCCFEPFRLSFMEPVWWWPNHPENRSRRQKVCIMPCWGDAV